MQFSQAGTEGPDVTTLKSMHCREELLVTEDTCAAEPGSLADLDEPRHAANVIVVPMRRDDELNGLCGVDTEASEIVQSSGCVGASAGVDHNPHASADVQYDALAVPRAEEGQLELIISRRLCADRHSLSARDVSRAHSLPSRKSRSVILGRSRNHICDTRLFVPAGDRS